MSSLQLPQQSSCYSRLKLQNLPLSSFHPASNNMKASSSTFVFFTCVGLSLASFHAYTANRLPDSQCHQRYILGQHGCCCGTSNPNCNNAFGHPCGGDISGDICPDSHILLLNGTGRFTDSTAVYTDGSCDVQSVDGGDCREQKWM